jgi:hypothetical protein
MTVLISSKNTAGLDLIVLEEGKGEGVYCFAFKAPTSSFPEWDYLQDTWELAKSFCLNEWGVPLDAWLETAEPWTRKS